MVSDRTELLMKLLNDMPGTYADKIGKTILTNFITTQTFNMRDGVASNSSSNLHVIILYVI